MHKHTDHLNAFIHIHSTDNSCLSSIINFLHVFCKLCDRNTSLWNFHLPVHYNCQKVQNINGHKNMTCANYEILLNIRVHKENVIKETVNFLSLTWVLLNLYFFVLWGRILTVKWASIFVCIQNINRSQQQKYDPCRPRGPFWNSQCELEIDRPFQQTRSLNIPTKVAFKEIDCL